MSYDFTTTLWMHHGEAAWHFASLPSEVADEIAEVTAGPRKGFGSVRVKATIGDTTWSTSIFPDATSNSYVLPIKKSVRSSEALAEGARLQIHLDLLDS